MLDFLNDLLWGKVLIAVLVVVGLLFTIASRFVQFRYFGQMFSIFGQATQHEEGHLSSFQALVLSVAGRVGAGNIAGVAVAITLGGPGAVFWMWVIGLIGMSTSFFECTLAQVFKNSEPGGTYRGGPAYYINRGLNNRWLASVFSVLLLVTFGFGFNALQSYTVAASLSDTFNVPTQITGVALLVILGVTIFGGVKRIADVAEFVVPIMAVGYFLMALFVIVTNIGSIPGVFGLIFRSAFGLEQAVSGGIGAAIIFGVKRGLFSNEAGLGSAPNVAAVAYVKHPVNQGIVQAFSVFIDTIVLCSCTASLILLSTVYEPGSDVAGITMTQAAMAEHVGEWGRAFVTIALVLFAFTSMIYNYYLGENSLNFFSEENKLVFRGFRILTLALVVWGSSQDLGTVFGFADVTMGLLALVNLAALVMLFKVGLKVMRDFDSQIQAGISQPVFNADDFAELNLDPDAWAAEERKPVAVAGGMQMP
ncbi:MAG: alanine/glycine:cation symporter family protein [Cyanobacteria bacterium P01_H01_bin.105]